MAADNTYLVDHETVHGPKLDELEVILRELVIEGSEKAVVFSQWLRMTELIEKMLDKNGIGYVHLNGGVPSRKRGGLMKKFKEDPACKVFLSTDAGGVGLNLQKGSVVINMDIPWNPAVLEQRIGRVHRMGQDRTVRVVNFISRASIEERILDLLRFKKSLFTGALDEDGTNAVMVGETGMGKFMESVEEAVAPLAAPDPDSERREQIEAAADERAAELRESAADDGVPAISGPGPVDEADAGTGTATGAGNGADAINTLLLSGAQFLMSLSKSISMPAGVQEDHSAAGNPSASYGNAAPPLQKAFQGMLGRDETTGKSYLKIPMPEEETMGRIVSGLGQLLSGFIKR